MMPAAESAESLFPALFGALRQNLPATSLREFLAFCAAGLGEPGVSEDVFAPAVPCIAVPALPVNADSETAEVAAWVASMGLQGRVVGAWVWVDDSTANRQTLGSKDELGAYLVAAGFVWSNRRQAWFHRCTVNSHATGKRGGKLERMHGVAAVGTFNPKAFDPRPEWLVQKERKKIRRRKAA